MPLWEPFQEAEFLEFKAFHTGSMWAPLPLPPESREACFLSTFRQRHRLTAAATSRVTTAGGSTDRLSGRPLSVTTLTASTTVHLSRAAEAANAAAGPLTTDHGTVATASRNRAEAKDFCNHVDGR